jgi:hypothetical protein
VIYRTSTFTSGRTLGFLRIFLQPLDGDQVAVDLLASRGEGGKEKLRR